MSKLPSLSSSVNLSKSMKSVSESTQPDLEALVANRQVQPAADPTPQPTKRYEGMKKMLIPIDPKIHRDLKMIALQRDTTLEKIVQEAVLQFVRSSSIK